MAHLDVRWIDEQFETLRRYGEGVEGIASAMLATAGQLVAESYRYSIIQHNHIDSHALYESIKASKPKTDGHVWSVTVAPRGTHSKDRHTPIANAYKGTILNSGRRASHWADEAQANAEGPAVEAMENIFDEWLNAGVKPSAGIDWADYVY